MLSFVVNKNDSSLSVFSIVSLDCCGMRCKYVTELPCVEISSAFSSLETTCSIDDLCCLSPVHDRASLNMRSKASIEYPPI